MAQTYRSYRGRGGRGGAAYGGRAGRERKIRRIELRLTFCLALAAAFSVARLLFPAFFGGIRDDITQKLGMEADFKSAAYVVGEAIRGEIAPGEAFSQACSFIFEGESGGGDVTEVFAEDGGESTAA